MSKNLTFFNPTCKALRVPSRLAVSNPSLGPEEVSSCLFRTLTNWNRNCPYFRMLVLPNCQTELNQIWRDGSLEARNLAVLISSQNIPPPGLVSFCGLHSLSRMHGECSKNPTGAHRHLRMNAMSCCKVAQKPDQKAIRPDDTLMGTS